MSVDSLYQSYVRERASLETLWESSYFVTYKISGEELFIADMFIKPSERSTGKLKQVIDSLVSIGKTNGCKFLAGNIGLKDPGASRTMRAALKVGFKIADANTSAILIIKDLGD